jgi:hypothetical protein
MAASNPSGNGIRKASRTGKSIVIIPLDPRRAASAPLAEANRISSRSQPSWLNSTNADANADASVAWPHRLASAAGVKQQISKSASSDVECTKNAFSERLF